MSLDATNPKGPSLMTRAQLKQVQEKLLDDFSVAVQADPDLVAGFTDGLDHMAKALEESGALQFTD